MTCIQSGHALISCKSEYAFISCDQPFCEAQLTSQPRTAEPATGNNVLVEPVAAIQVLSQVLGTQ